eukprot:s164_g19.t1
MRLRRVLDAYWCVVGFGGGAFGYDCEGWPDRLVRKFGDPVIPARRLLKVERSLEELHLPQPRRNSSRGLFLVLDLRGARTAQEMQGVIRAWTELSAHSLLALRVSKPTSDVLELLRRFFFATQQRHWYKKPGPMPAISNADEVSCDPCGCLAQKAISADLHLQDYHNAAANYLRWEGRVRGQHPFFSEALKYQTDKVTYHRYELFYHRTLPRHLDHDGGAGCFLEIGFGCVAFVRGVALSAGVWPVVFPGANVHILEIDGPCVQNLSTWLQKQNYSVHIVDAGAVLELERLKHDVFQRGCPHGLLSVVVDDGSHNSSDLVTTFLSLYPSLKPGGQYYMEDLGLTSYNVYDSLEPMTTKGQERPGTAFFFVTSLLGGLFTKRPRSYAPFQDVGLLRCWLNICLVEKLSL